MLCGAVLVGSLSAIGQAQNVAADSPAPSPEPVRGTITLRAQGAASAQAQAGPVPPEAVRRTEKGAYLGVSTSTPVAALRQQLSLPAGVGLVVDAVAEKSPAADAGLRQLDVLHKLNDQVLVNQQQLAVLVRTFKAGEEIKLTVFREGKSMELSAKLVERDLPPLDDLRFGMVEGRLLPERVELFPPGGVAGARAAVPPGLMNDEFVVAWDDGTINMTITGKGGKRTLVARDAGGKELFNGPIDTPEDREKLPPELKDRLKEIGPGGMFRFGMRAGEGRRGADGPRLQGITTRPTTTSDERSSR
jgi:hypothetical protein